MKCLLVPIDFSDSSGNLLEYITGLSNCYQIEKVLLLKVFHISEFARTFPTADLIQLGTEEVVALRNQSEDTFRNISQAFRKKLNPDTEIEPIYLTDELLPAISYLLVNRNPEMIALGGFLNHDDPEGILEGSIISIAKMSSVPVLLVPDQCKFKDYRRVLLPTSFQNLEKLQSLLKLIRPEKFQATEVIVLNVDNKHRHDEIEEDDKEIMGRYLRPFTFRMAYSYNEDIPGEILRFGAEEDVQLILALPGKHHIFYDLTHKRVTKNFAVRSRLPVLLLK